MKEFKEIYDDIYMQLNKIYETEIKQVNVELNEKKSKFMIKQILINLIIIVFGFMFFKSSVLMFIVQLILFVVIINIAIYSVRFNKEQKQLSFKFKNCIIQKLISKVFNEECVLNIEKGISETEYNGDIYGDMYNRYSSSDLVILKENKLMFSEVLVKHYTRNGKSSSTVTVFEGIAGQKVLNKDINCNISILSNRLFMNNRVKLDSAEFEKYFDIKCDDKILAVRFLTSDIMAIMVDLREKYNCRFEFSIVNEKMYFRISTYYNFFEVPNLKNGLNIEYFKKNTGMLLQIKKLTMLIDDVVKDI